MITPEIKTRVTFDFNYDSDAKRRESHEKLVQIICSSHWASGIDILGILYKDHAMLFDMVKNGVIVIDECEYEVHGQYADSETAWLIKSLLGKRNNHPVLLDMATLFADEPFDASRSFRNTLYLPNHKAFVRADGMKPENITRMLQLEECEKIILFPYFPIDGKSAYYELTLAVEKGSFLDYLRRVDESRIEEMNEAINRADTRSIEGYHKATLRIEKQSDWKTVEQITYRAFRDAPPTGDDDGKEALLARNLRSRPAFVPELNYVAEMEGKIVGNIMYTRSKIINDDGGKWETLTFGPVSVLPKYQKQGVGSALIRRSLDTARKLGYRAVLIYGHESYYPRFGFRPASDYGITTAEGKNFPAFMALALHNGALDGVSGQLICDEAYSSLNKEESDKLNTKLAEPMDVDEYIANQPEHLQNDLQAVRLMIRMTLQIYNAIEKISWGMPTYWKEQNLIHFAVHKNHLGIYPGEEALVHFAPRLVKYKTSKGAIQFPYKDLISEHLTLITEIAAWCGSNAEG
jgi:predicted N-acetyltransferase YhbS/uncharacterized protein YdhG (YjbR/CyaY superfamily)